MKTNTAKSIDAFSFMEYLFRFSPGVTNFRIPGLNSDIHFSISHHPNSDQVNFHVTRNLSDEENKPKIVVCEMAKDDLNAWLKVLLSRSFDMLYEKLPALYLRKAKYIPFDKMKWLERESAAVINSVGKVKKRKLKLPDTLFDSIEECFKVPSVRYRMKQAVKPFPDLIDCGFQAGVLWKDNDISPVLLTPTGCYRQRENFLADNLLKLLPDERLARRIHLKTALAVKLVSMAQTRQELAGMVRPINISLLIRESITSLT